MYFLIEDGDLLAQYNTIWDKVSADIKKNLIASLSIIKELLQTKIKFDGDEVIDFYDKKFMIKRIIMKLIIKKTLLLKEKIMIKKLDSNHTFLAIISLDSALKKDENYYPQVFLKEFKYIEKKSS